MSRSDLERLSREELIELVLRLQRPEKTSRTSSKPPSTDRKEQRDQAKPGGAKPGHEGYRRTLSPDPDEVVAHRPGQCSCCGGALTADLPAEIVSVSERIELPEVTPVVTQHQRLAVRCPSCGTRVVAPAPREARGTPFGPRLHAMAVYLKTYPRPLLRAPAGHAVRPVRAHLEPGRADEPTSSRPRAVPCRSRSGGLGAASGRGGGLGRDWRPDRRQQLVSLGLPLGRSGGASRRPDAGCLRRARDDGRPSARGVDLGSLHRPAGPR